MNRIVKQSMKVDFHIHSCWSKYKDELSLVSKSDISNLSILINKLNENEINMCSITDHDYFSYDLYSELKKYENQSTLKKVFPGVEFSVGLPDENRNLRQVHIICIFDDEDKEKVRKIQSCIPFKNDSVLYDAEGNKYFSEEKFISILREIDLNVVLIAHQKQSITSTSASKSKNDLSSLGSVKFNELIACEYFESLEFKNMKNGLFNRNYAINLNKNYDQLRFITGSDCHDWNVYPKHDSDDNNEINFEFTYLKCLPCFRGLAMAFSDTRRISTTSSLFSSNKKMLDEINISINGDKFLIPLSPGINVIIGDNSIGKSLLLHKMTNYEYLINDTGDRIKKGYQKYLSNNNISIETTINQKDIYLFDYQGSIREKFSQDNQDNTFFLNQKFPVDINVEPYKIRLFSEYEKLFSCLKNKFDYDDELKKINSLIMVDEEITLKNLYVTKITNNQDNIKKFKKLKSYYEGIIAKIETNFSLITVEEEIYTLNNFLDKLKVFKNKYDVLVEKEEKVFEQKSFFNNAIKSFNDDTKNWKSELESIKNRFDGDDSDNMAETIAKLINLKQSFSNFEFNIKEEELNSEILRFGDYLFVKKLKNCRLINNDYLENVLERIIRCNANLDISKITKEELRGIIVNYKDDNKDPIDVLRKRVHEIIDDDLKSIPSITLNGKDVYSKLSNGMNSAIYFDILSTDMADGIYIIDQPEDDISQNSIKSNVLDKFKLMSNYRQIIMITHNPQFVVNLDVDNVICLKKDEEGKIKLVYGALEFTDKDIDILDTVAKCLDGGIETIRKRWKRYEKAVKTN